MAYQVFISYRRKTGAFTARTVYNELKIAGINAFMDYEGLERGKFNEQIQQHISRCNDFVLILTPGSLDECGSESNWLRKEIEWALQYKKNIIPVMDEEFIFPKELPESIKEIKNYHGITLHKDCPNASIEGLKKLLYSEEKAYDQQFIEEDLPYYPENDMGGYGFDRSHIKSDKERLNEINEGLKETGLYDMWHFSSDIYESANIYVDECGEIYFTKYKTGYRLSDISWVNTYNDVERQLFDVYIEFYTDEASFYFKKEDILDARFGYALTETTNKFIHGGKNITLYFLKKGLGKKRQPPIRNIRMFWDRWTYCCKKAGLPAEYMTRLEVDRSSGHLILDGNITDHHFMNVTEMTYFPLTNNVTIFVEGKTNVYITYFMCGGTEFRISINEMPKIEGV